VRLSAHSAFHWWSAHCATRMLLLSEKLMSCCAAGTNGCLDLRRHAAAPDGRVSAEWSRCPGSMARLPRDSVAPLRRSSTGWMPARIESNRCYPYWIRIESQELSSHFELLVCKLESNEIQYFSFFVRKWHTINYKNGAQRAKNDAQCCFSNFESRLFRSNYSVKPVSILLFSFTVSHFQKSSPTLM